MKEKTPLSLRLETALQDRLDACSERTKLKKYSLVLMAIEAAVEAIEQNDYQLVVPIKFGVAKIPLQKKEIISPIHAHSSHLNHPAPDALLPALRLHETIEKYPRSKNQRGPRKKLTRLSARQQAEKDADQDEHLAERQERADAPRATPPPRPGKTVPS